MSYSYDINHLCDITNTECSSKGSEMQSTSRTAQRPPEPTLVCFWTGALPGTLKCSCTEAKIQPRQAQWRGFWAHPWPGNGEHKLPLRCAVFMWLSRVRLCDPVDYGLPGSSVHGLPRQEYS